MSMGTYNFQKICCLHRNNEPEFPQHLIICPKYVDFAIHQESDGANNNATNVDKKKSDKLVQNLSILVTALKSQSPNLMLPICSAFGP